MNQSSSLHDFPIGVYTITLKLESSAHLGEFKGSALRGMMGKALLQLQCIYSEKDPRLGDCESCFYRYQCLFHHLFNSPNPDTLTWWTGSHIPHPFIIRSSFNTKTVYSTGDELSLDLILFGQPVQFLPLFLKALIFAGENGWLGSKKSPQDGFFTIQSVDSCYDKVNYWDQKFRMLNIIPPTTLKNLLDLCPVIDGQDHRLIIECLTPHIITKNAFSLTDLQMITPERWLTLLSERLLLLAHFYGTGEPFPRPLLPENCGISVGKKQLEVKRIARYSNRKDEKMKFTGWVGSWEWKEGWYPWIELLWIGQFINIGKQTSFGLGHYQLKFLPKAID